MAQFQHEKRMQEVAAWAETGSMTAVQGGGVETVMHEEVETVLDETGSFSSSSAISLDFNDGGEEEEEEVEEMETEEGEEVELEAASDITSPAITISSSEESDDPIVKEDGVIPGSPR